MKLQPKILHSTLFSRESDENEAKYVTIDVLRTVKPRTSENEETALTASPRRQ
jgi:hypothetical protein